MVIERANQFAESSCLLRKSGDDTCQYQAMSATWVSPDTQELMTQRRRPLLQLRRVPPVPGPLDDSNLPEVRRLGTPGAIQ